MTRSIIDTEAELDERATGFSRLMLDGDWSNAFVRHHIKKLIVEAQQDAGERAADNLTASMERPWTHSAPVPAAAVREALPPPRAPIPVFVGD